MGVLISAWNKLTNTNSLVLASGKFELDFFEFLYRVIYLAGLSATDHGVAYLTYSTTIKLLLILLVSCELWQFFADTWTINKVMESVNVIFIQFGAFYKYIIRYQLGIEQQVTLLFSTPCSLIYNLVLISICIQHLQWCVKYNVNNRDVFKSLASAMESRNFDLSTPRRKIIFELWRKRNAASLALLLGLGSCTLLVWLIYPLVDDLEYNLMVVAKWPLQYQTPARYPLIYTITLIVFSYISYFVMVNDLILQTHLMHLLCQFAVLNDCFENILNDCQANLRHLTRKNLHLNKEFQQEYTKRLGELVEQHKLILNNTLRLRDMLSAPMLAQLAVSTTLICSIGFQVATSVNVNRTKWLMNLLYLGYNMFVVYVICRWCEEIKIQSAKIGEAVYFSGWQNGIVTVPGVRTSILLILARANKPMSLSAGGMYDLTLEAYATLVKTSYSALTVLLRFR